MGSITPNVTYIEDALKKLGVEHTSHKADPEFWSGVNSLLKKLGPLVDGLPSEYGKDTGQFLQDKLAQKHGILSKIEKAYKGTKLAAVAAESTEAKVGAAKAAVEATTNKAVGYAASLVGVKIAESKSAPPPSQAEIEARAEASALKALQIAAKGLGIDISDDVLPLVPQLLEFSKKTPEFVQHMTAVYNETHPDVPTPSPAAAKPAATAGAAPTPAVAKPAAASTNAAPAAGTNELVMQQPGKYTFNERALHAQESMAKLAVLMPNSGIDLGKTGKNNDGLDGKFGPLTRDSIKATQKILGLEESGKITAEFEKKLQERFAQPAPTPGVTQTPASPASGPVPKPTAAPGAAAPAAASPAASSSPPVTGPGGMTLDEATRVAEQSLVNIIALVKSMKPSATFTAPGPVGGEFDEQSRVAGYEVLGSLLDLLKIENPGVYTPALGQTLKRALDLPDNAIYKKMIIDADGEGAFKNEKELDDLIRALDTLSLNHKLDRKPGEVAPGGSTTPGSTAPAKVPVLTPVQASLLKWVVNSDPKLASLMDQLLRGFTGYGLDALLPGVNIPGLDRTGKQPLSASFNENLQTLFKEVYADGKDPAQVRNSIITRTEGILQLPFGDAPRSDAYRAMVKTGLDNAQTAVAAGKMDDAAKIFADSITTGLEALNRDHPPVIRQPGAGYVVDQSIYNMHGIPAMTATDKKHPVAQLYDAINEGNGPYNQKALIFKDENGKIYVAGVEKGSHLFTVKELDLNKIETEAAKIPSLAEVKPEYGAAAMAQLNGLAARLRQEDEGYNLAKGSYPLQFRGATIGLIEQAKSAKTLTEIRADLDAQKVRDDAEVARRNAATPPVVQSPPPVKASFSAAAVPQTPAPQKPLPRDEFARTIGDKAQAYGEEEVAQRAVRNAPSIFTNDKSKGNVLVEYRGRDGQNHFVDLTEPMNYYRSFAVGSKEFDHKISVRVLDEMHLTKVPDAKDPLYKTYDKRFGEEQNAEKMLAARVAAGMGLSAVPKATDIAYGEYVSRFMQAKHIDIKTALGPQIADIARAYPQFNAHLFEAPLALAEHIENRFAATGAGRKHDHAAGPSDNKYPDVYADTQGKALVRYQGEDGQTHFADVTAQMKYFLSFHDAKIVDSKGKIIAAPKVTSDEYPKFVREYAKQHGFNPEDGFASFSSSSKDWLGTVLKSDPAFKGDIVDLVAALEKRHGEIAAIHTHRGGLTAIQNKAAAGEVYDAPAKLPVLVKTTAELIQDNITSMGISSGVVNAPKQDAAPVYTPNV